MCTRYPIINRVSELKVHIELTRFVQPEKIEIDANERAVNKKSQYCFFVCTTFDSFLNDLSYNNLYMHKKQYIYENTLNPKSTQFIFPYIKCSRIFHFLTKCFPYQNFKIIDIKFWKECISIFNI